MAYAALTSLKQTLYRLLNSSNISIAPPCPDIGLLLNEICSLFITCVEGSETLTVLLKQMREDVSEFEDTLESYVTDQLRGVQSQSSCFGDGKKIHQLTFTIDLDEISQAIVSFRERVQNMKAAYETEVQKLRNSFSEPESVDESPSSRLNNSDIVGLSDNLEKIRRALTDDWSALKLVPILGMAGIGKTTIAKLVYEDPLVSDHFDCRAWITVGRRRYRVESALFSILSQTDSNVDVDSIAREEAASCVKKSLMNKRYLIVLDDVWNTYFLKDLVEKVRNWNKGSRILLTTRLGEVASACGPGHERYKMQFLDKDESWRLLCLKVFGRDRACPRQLEKFGKKIAKNCEGLPLAIIEVADQLSRREKTLECWKQISEDQDSIIVCANDAIARSLLSSFSELSESLKANFLYMGVFRQKYEIPRNRLINLWIAERIEGSIHQGKLQLEELVSKSLVLVCQPSSLEGFGDGTKTCRLHYVYRQLCRFEAAKDKFFHVMNVYDDGFTDDIKNQRRLCVRKNVLFGIKDVFDSMASVSSVRSILCVGPLHQFPVPVCTDLKLLRVLDALTIRFLEFPKLVLNLIQLRYLAFTCNQELPSSIHKLFNLEYLIVSRHIPIKYRDYRPIFLPEEIWYMKELKHLQVTGSDLPYSPCDDEDAVLPKLLALLDVSPYSCSDAILKRIPKLERLGILIELGPIAPDRPMSCFDHLRQASHLRSLKCVVMNPIPKCSVVSFSSSHENFPVRLRKLNLSGLGYPWKYMSVIAKMPCLESLKLRCNAFQGPVWDCEGESYSFVSLRYLLIEDADLSIWRADDFNFPSMRKLIVRHCYRLKTIPFVSHSIPFCLGTIEIVDCDPLVAESAKRIAETKMGLGGRLPFRVLARFSWDDDAKKKKPPSYKGVF